MTTTLRYNNGQLTQNIDFEDDQAAQLRQLIGAIVSAGKAEWLRVPVTDNEGTASVTTLLIAPGIPIFFTGEAMESDDVARLNRALWDRYPAAQ